MFNADVSKDKDMSRSAGHQEQTALTRLLPGLDDRGQFKRHSLQRLATLKTFPQIRPLELA